MASSIQFIVEKIEQYKRKYYLNQLIKGILIGFSVLLISFLIFTTIEYFSYLGTLLRAILFFSFLGILSGVLFFWIVKPLFYLYLKNKPLTTNQAAADIGIYFPEIKDKLLNTLQLSQQSDQDNSLVEAAIHQRVEQLKFVHFTDSIQLNKNRRYIKFIAVPLTIILLIVSVVPQFFSESSKRIIQFQNHFSEPAPFQFIVENQNFKAFKNDDFTITVLLTGKALPNQVFIFQNDRQLKMETSDGKHYNYTFTKVQEDINFYFEAAGFHSETQHVKIHERPQLSKFFVELTYPTYTGKPKEKLENLGNISVPSGTHIRWVFEPYKTQAISLLLGNDTLKASKSILNSDFIVEYKAKKTQNYSIQLQNEHSTNKESIHFLLNVIEDQFPTLSFEQKQDSVLYNYVAFGGTISDDYGFSSLQLMYRIIKNGTATRFNTISLPFQKSQPLQNYFYAWKLDSLKLEPTDKIEYFVQVSDNDALNGFKKAHSSTQMYAIPSKKNIDKEIESSINKTEAQIDASLSKAQKLKKDISQLEKRLKNKSTIDFQDKKMAEELLKKQEELREEIKKIQEQHQSLSEKQNLFEKPNEELKKKMEELQKLMNDLLDEQTKKMYEELQELLNNNQEQKALDVLEKLKNREKNLEKDIDRSLQLFKKIQLDQKIDKTVKKMESLSEKQEKLAEKTEKQEPKEDNFEPLQKEQKEVEKEFEDIKKDINEVEKDAQNMKESFDNERDTQKEIEQEFQKSKDNLEKKDKNEASKAQKKAAQKMKKIAKKMEEQKKTKQKQQFVEDRDNLRAILENLVKLSFDQEQIMNDFQEMNLNDPRFLKSNQQQIKLQGDVQVIEDSLYALAKRVVTIKTVVTKELNAMKTYMDESVKFIKERKFGNASVKQQFSMTSINNLALLLSDILRDMDNEGDGDGGQMSKIPKKKPSKTPSLSDLQKKLNQQIQSLKEKQGQMSGRKMSEELAKIAYQQAKIRQYLQQLNDQANGTEAGKKVKKETEKLLDKMQDIENDAVNKQIDKITQQRQKDLLTRLLESEKALQEQDEDSIRKGETANQIRQNKLPLALEKIIKEKQKQVELLRTVPPSFHPFYKKEISTYFRKL